MYILDYLVQLVSKAQEPRQMVELAMRAIAIDLGARSCRLFIRKHGSELVLSESFGAHANLEEAKAGEELAREALLNVLLSGADTPTASWRAAPLVSDLASEVDFFSIGTNDLIQYSLVVDREDPRLSSPHHAFHPAIWRMIQRVIATARTAEKEVNVCGEMAARPEIAIALVALGVSALSLTPRAIPELKQKLSQVDLSSLRSGLAELLRARNTAELEHELRTYLLDHSVGDC